MNVVMFMIDSMRLDHYLALGYQRVFFPGRHFLCRTRHNQTRFAVPSLLTGLETPHVDTNSQQMWLNTGYQWVWNVYIKEKTMFDYFKEAGYDTFYMNADPYTDMMDGGYPAMFPQLPYIRCLRDFFRIKKEPYLLYIHLWDVHYPYGLPFMTIEQLVQFFAQYGPTEFYKNAALRMRGKLSMLKELLDAKTDEKDSILYVLTGDHGEKLGEGRQLFHVVPMTDEVTHIPLTFYHNRNTMKHEYFVSGVEQHQILPTLLDICNIKHELKGSFSNKIIDTSKEVEI